MNFIAKIFVNIFAIFILVFLISLPTVFSIGFFKFDPQINWQGFTITSQKSRFSEYLEIKGRKESERLSFNLTVTALSQKEAFYKRVLEVKNNSNSEKEIKIEKNEDQAQVFFAQNDEKTGPLKFNLQPGETIGINVLTGESDQNREKREVNFILRE